MIPTANSSILWPTNKEYDVSYSFLQSLKLFNLKYNPFILLRNINRLRFLDMNCTSEYTNMYKYPEIQYDLIVRNILWILVPCCIITVITAFIIAEYFRKKTFQRFQFGDTRKAAMIKMLENIERAIMNLCQQMGRSTNGDADIFNDNQGTYPSDITDPLLFESITDFGKNTVETLAVIINQKMKTLVNELQDNIVVGKTLMMEVNSRFDALEEKLENLQKIVRASGMTDGTCVSCNKDCCCSGESNSEQIKDAEWERCFVIDSKYAHESSNNLTSEMKEKPTLHKRRSASLILHPVSEHEETKRISIEIIASKIEQSSDINTLNIELAFHEV